MLKKLQVEQFVIIDKLDLDFEDRLTIFTGETGAGKSIILGAMGLILGEPSKPASIRAGASQSTFEALFAPESGHPVWDLLIKNDLAKASDKEFTIHRIMKHRKVQPKDTDGQVSTPDKEKDNKKDDGQGEDEIKLNGKDIPIKALRKIGSLLVEIHGQHANQSLLGPKNQLHLLDLSGAFPQEIFDNVANALNDVHRYTKELEEEKLFLARHKGLEGQKVEKICATFDSVGMEEGFIEKTKEEYAVLLTAKETGEAFQSILGRLIATGGVVGSLAASKNTIEDQKNLDQEKIKKLKNHIETALSEARYAVQEMGELLPEYEIDLDPLNKKKKILTTLKSLSTENKINFSALEDFWRQEKTKLFRIKNGREKMAELKDALIQAKNNYREHAHILTEKRIAAGEALSKAITAEFAPLMLNKAEFQVAVEEKPDIEWTPLGFNEVTFKARMNPGMPFSPIAETASGGELARMILALKVVLQLVQTTSTLVFDEVDTGIGGKAAAAVGERIAHLAETTQVLVITHSPQVASRGDQHLHISKRVEGEMTISSVRELTMDERVDEVSRMLAGDELTDESKAAAMSLINEAKNAATARRQNIQSA